MQRQAVGFAMLVVCKCLRRRRFYETGEAFDIMLQVASQTKKKQNKNTNTNTNTNDALTF
jgi:hypothetical protein